MSKDKLATLAGAVTAVAMTLPKMGVDFGHIGSVTGLGAISAFGMLFLGWLTNKQ